MNQKAGNAGFTLVEMLMVILIAGIVSAVVLPQFISFKTDAATAVTNDRLREFKIAITGDPRAVSNGEYIQPGFEIQNSGLPVTLNDLRVQGSYTSYDPFTKRGWRGPYITTTDTTWNLDGWKITIQYDRVARTLRSCGPDKVCSNADDIVVQF